MYLPKELGKKHLLKGSSLYSIQVTLNCDGAKESLSHDCPFLLEELQGAAVDYFINGISHRDF